MGDINQRIYLTSALPTADGPVLEVGSKQHGSTSSFRDFYKGEYVGIDQESGDGVDRVIDLTEPAPNSMLGRYALIICCSVLEHVTRPWIAAGNISLLARPGCKLYVSVPWVWRYHPYPDDYWRFSWSGIGQLFPDFAWGDPAYSTSKDGEFFKAIHGADERLSGRAEGRKFLPYLMLHMIGTKKSPAEAGLRL